MSNERKAPSEEKRPLVRVKIEPWSFDREIQWVYGDSVLVASIERTPEASKVLWASSDGGAMFGLHQDELTLAGISLLDGAKSAMSREARERFEYFVEGVTAEWAGRNLDVESHGRGPKADPL